MGAVYNLNPLIEIPVNNQYGRPYDYVAKFPALPSGGSQSVNVEIDASFVFKWQKLSFDLWQNNVTQVLTNNLLIQITDSRSSRNFFDSPLPLSIFCGNGNDPTQGFILPVPHLFDPSCVILVTLQAPASGLNSDVDIVFGGIKIPVSSQGFG